MTVLGGVTHIAIVHKGHVLYDENVEDGREYATLGARMRAELVKASSRDPSSLD